ncbi:MAG: hypothetical protein RL686_578 [Pseudomonadota bacterium]
MSVVSFPVPVKTAVGCSDAPVLRERGQHEGCTEKFKMRSSWSWVHARVHT